MKNNEVLFAYIRPESQNQGLEWLMLTPPRSEVDKACFIYLFYNISATHVFDEWFENIESAYKWAEEAYNVTKNEWKTLDDILKIGIKFDSRELEFIQEIKN